MIRYGWQHNDQTQFVAEGDLLVAVIKLEPGQMVSTQLKRITYPEIKEALEKVSYRGDGKNYVWNSHAQRVYVSRHKDFRPLNHKEG